MKAIESKITHKVKVPKIEKSTPEIAEDIAQFRQSETLINFILFVMISLVLYGFFTKDSETLLTVHLLRQI